MEDVIQDLVQARLAEFVAELDAEAVEAGLAIPGQRRADPVARRLEEVEAALGKSERAIAKHMRVYAMADDDDQDGLLESAYLETLKALRAEKASLAAERDRLKESVDGGGVEAVRGAAVPVAVGLLEEWDTLGPAHLNAMLRRVVGRVDLLGDGEAKVWLAWEV